MSLRTKYDSEKKIKKIKEYCKNEMSKNYYLRLANEQYTSVKGDFPGHNGHEHWMYFDFKYNFIYCPTPKVTQ